MIAFLIFICFRMYAGHCASAWVVLSLKRSIPCKGFGGGTGYTRYAGYAFCRTRTGEVLLKDGAVVVLFLVHRRVYGEALGGFPHLFVTDGSGGHRFQRINPVVTHTVSRMATSRNSLSRKGTRPSTPHAERLLLARRQS